MLAARGYAVLGVDPEAPDEPGFVRARFEEIGRASCRERV